jgi:hypothetical protein
VGLGPHRPIRDLERAIERSDLDMAVAIARDVGREQGQPIPLDLALGFLPLVVVQQLDSYDGWACRWLVRWLLENPGATIDQAAEIAGALAELPAEPSALETLRGSVRGRRAPNLREPGRSA